MSNVYTCFCTDVIHEGHLNIIKEAQKYGEVTVGVLSDRAVIKYLRFPTKSLEERMEMIKKIPEVYQVIVQNEIMYDEVFDTLHPDVIVHGDNWKEGHLAIIRENVIGLIKKHGGKLVEIPYTQNENVVRISNRLKHQLAMPEYRRGRLRKLFGLCDVVKTIEVHSGITGLIAEKTVVAKDGELNQFDAMWLSSLSDSTEKGKPDIELVDITSRVRTLNDVMEVTTKPIIFDGDTGGLIEHFVYTVRTLERLGVSAIIIEDKVGLKRNSLFGTDVFQTQDTIDGFCEKISEGKSAQLTEEFMIIARIESLILEKGVEDALQRARAYVAAGADGIMIHSRKSDPGEVFEFCDRFRRADTDTPLVAVPTSYNRVTEAELAAHGVNIVIYANHLMRSAYPAMEETARDILSFHRSLEADARLMPVEKTISLIEDI